MTKLALFSGNKEEKKDELKGVRSKLDNCKEKYNNLLCENIFDIKYRISTLNDDLLEATSEAKKTAIRNEIAVCERQIKEGMKKVKENSSPLQEQIKDLQQKKKTLKIDPNRHSSSDASSENSPSPSSSSPSSRSQSPSPR